MQFPSYIRNVVVTAAMVIFSLNGFDTRPIRLVTIKCDQENHEYYNEQFKTCGKCDRCWQGQEVELEGADLGMSIRGATKCPNCRDCGHGTYNPNGDVYWYCIPCTVCEKLGQYEVQACSPIQDAKCNKTAPTLHQRSVPKIPGFQEYVNEGPKHNGEGSNLQSIKDALYVVIGILVLALIGFTICIKKRRTCQGDRGNPTSTNREDLTPLPTIPSGDIAQQQAEISAADIESESDPSSDDLSSLQDSYRERRPLIPGRQQYPSRETVQQQNESSGDESDPDSPSDQLSSLRDINVDRRPSTVRERKASGGTNPAFKRQISDPITSSEVGNTREQLDKSRPTQTCLLVLAKLLAPKEKYKAFAIYMKLEKHELENLEEELRERDLRGQDLAFEYVSKSLNCKPKLCYP
ncbi:uncharacterized protein [Argopecten irradians]|uniref:uncharacterized protein n=1 Tax=Argopecten irradians TaxID=31199 RepID=UPI003716E67E